jgi:hypothetical protein
MPLLTETSEKEEDMQEAEGKSGMYALVSPRHHTFIHCRFSLQQPCRLSREVPVQQRTFFFPPLD